MSPTPKLVAPVHGNDIVSLSASELVDHYRKRSLSPIEVARAVLERIHATSEINAFVALDETATLNAAQASETRWKTNTPIGALDGVPVTLEDLLDVRGFPTRKGSRTTSDDPIRLDSPVAARLRENGALLLGKTTTSEFGLKCMGSSPLTGSTRNPWDPKRGAGGSSAGAAAAVAAGIGPIAVAADSGGSIRTNAAWAGVVGFKPTFGRIPTSPSIVAGSPAVVGPIARTVSDIALFMTMLSVPDSRDPFRLPSTPQDHQKTLDFPLTGLSFGAIPLNGPYSIDKETVEAFERSLDVFRSLGAKVERIERMLPYHGSVLKTFLQAQAAQATRNLSGAQREILDPEVLELAGEGAHLSALDFLAAEEERTRLAGILSELQTVHDLILTPSTAAPAPPLDGTVDPLWSECVSRSPFTALFSLTRQPAISMPMGFTSTGLPLGMQIAGRPFEGSVVLRAARSFELRRDIRESRTSSDS